MIDYFLNNLKKLNDAHLKEGEAITKAFGGAVYPFDLLTFAVLNRSMSLVSGFITLMRSDNFVASAPLIRLQLDNFLRFGAGWLACDPHKFATAILKGIFVKNLKTRDGKKMTDRFLVNHFSKEYDWISSVYNNTSGYIHLSEKHMFVNVTDVNSKERTSTYKISDRDEHLPEEIKVEAIKAFVDITKLVLNRAYSWRCTKENPPGFEKKPNQPFA